MRANITPLQVLFHLISADCALLAKGWQARVSSKMTLTALTKPLPNLPEDDPK